jgi:predicted transposase/invertase (TIGR01784 family)
MTTSKIISNKNMTTRLVRFDWAMKKLLRSKANFGILEGFLSELLGKDLKIIELLESESNKENEDDKFNKVDILVKLNNGEIVLIELQVNTQFDYFHRMLFGTSKVITEHIIKGQAYANLKKVFSVNILYFDLGHGSDYIYHGTTSFIGVHNNDLLDLNEKQKSLYQKKYIHEIYPEYYLIKVNQFNDIAKNTLDEWIYFLKNEKVEDNFCAKGLSEAREKLAALKMPEEERKQYERFLENSSYKASVSESNFAAGRIEGITEGKIEGKFEANVENAKKMKKLGISKEVAQQITGLSTEEISKIFTK